MNIKRYQRQLVLFWIGVALLALAFVWAAVNTYEICKGGLTL